MLVELFIVFTVYQSMIENGYNTAAKFFIYAFVVWFIVNLILKATVGTATSILGYLYKKITGN